MATRQVLADLVAGFAQQSGTQAAIESVGGVDAAKRVAAGEAFDVVILASDAIDKLMAAGHLVPGSKVDWVHSGVAVAVPAGAPLAWSGARGAGRKWMAKTLSSFAIFIANPWPAFAYWHPRTHNGQKLGAQKSVDKRIQLNTIALNYCVRSRCLPLPPRWSPFPPGYRATSTCG